MSEAPLSIAIIDCEDAPKWDGHVDLWRAPLAAAAFRTQVYRAFDGELPDDGFDGVVITGSHYSANDESPWVGALQRRVRELAAGGARVYGTCFGAHIVGAAWGGTVSANASGRFAFGAERVVAIGGGASRLGWEPGGSRTLLQSHGEFVAVLPPDAELLAKSATCPHEIFTIGSNVLAVQAHPEMAPALMTQRILPSLLEKGRLDDAEAAAAVASMEQPLDCAAMLATVVRFLGAAR